MTNVEPKTLKLEKEFIRCPEHFNTLDCDLKIFQDCRLWSRLTWRLPAPAAAAVSAAFAFSAFALPMIPPMNPPAPSAGASPFSAPWGWGGGVRAAWNILESAKLEILVNSEAKSTREQCLGFLLPRSFLFLSCNGRKGGKGQKIKLSGHVGTQASLCWLVGDKIWSFLTFLAINWGFLKINLFHWWPGWSVNSMHL